MVKPGDNLAEQIVGALGLNEVVLQDGDVVVVTSKIVSKAEGQVYDVTKLTVSERAEALSALTGKESHFVEMVLRESTEVSRARQDVLLVRHRLGFVSANAGLDHSNLGHHNDDLVLLLPKDPDRSARDIRDHLEIDSGVRVAVVLSDTHGRPFRKGNIGVAIGVSGLTPLVIQRGEADLFGRVLLATDIPLADQLASAAGMVTGEAAEGWPVVVIRGARHVTGDGSAKDLIWPAHMDLYAAPDKQY